MEEKPTKLDASTLIPVSGLVVLIGGVFWVTSMYNLVQSNAQAIDTIRMSITETNQSRAEYRSRLWSAIRNQDKRLASIEGKLDIIAEIVTEQLAEDSVKENK